MNIWFVGRHTGALEWVKNQDIAVTKTVTHLSQEDWPGAGDIVIGTLPVQLVAELNILGVRFMHLQLTLTEADRGRELTADDMNRLGAKLVEYIAMRIQPVSNDNSQDNDEVGWNGKRD